MSSTVIEVSNVMKQNEHYNLNSTPQLTAIQKSFSYIEKAVEEHNAAVCSTDTFLLLIMVVRMVQTLWLLFKLLSKLYERSMEQMYSIKSVLFSMICRPMIGQQYFKLFQHCL
jgi:hypothetical protein